MSCTPGGLDVFSDIFFMACYFDRKESMKKTTRETEPSYKESKNLMTDFLEEYRGLP